MNTFRHILVPTDFSPHAEEATRVASDIARRYDARVTLIHVYEPVATTAPDGFVFIPPRALEQLFEHYEKRLADARESATAAGAAHVETRLLQGPTASEIVDFAKERAVDLIVMGTHGRTGVTRFLLGSVAERVVRTAECAVLTVKPPAPSPHRE